MDTDDPPELYGCGVGLVKPASLIEGKQSIASYVIVMALVITVV